MSKPTSLAGQAAPPFAMKAVATGRTFSPADHKGKPVLLLFANHNTGRATQGIVETVRRRYPHYARLPIALVIDARIVPRLFRGVAEGQMEKEYRETAAQVPTGFDPADHLILLPDWKGEVAKAYHAGDLDHHVKLVVIGADGRVQAEYQGPEPGERALELLGPLLDND